MLPPPRTISVSPQERLKAMSLQDRADCTHNFDLIKACLKKCDNHSLCTRVPPYVSTSSFPRRLIDIGTEESQEDPKLVLVS